MLALYIIGGILLLIAIALALSIVFEFNYENGAFDFKIKYGFLTIMAQPLSEKKKKKKAAKKAKKAKKKAKAKAKKEKSLTAGKKIKNGKTVRGSSESEQTNPVDEKDNDSGQSESSKNSETEEKPEKSENTEKSGKKLSLKQIDFDIIKQAIDGASPHLKRILKKIRIYELYIDFVIATGDAAKTAIRYGTVSAVVNSVICWLGSVITLQVGEVNIEADFMKEKSDMFIHGKVKLRMSTLLHSAFGLGIAVLKLLMKMKQNAETSDSNA